MVRKLSPIKWKSQIQFWPPLSWSKSHYTLNSIERTGEKKGWFGSLWLSFYVSFFFFNENLSCVVWTNVFKFLWNLNFLWLINLVNKYKMCSIGPYYMKCDGITFVSCNTAHQWDFPCDFRPFLFFAILFVWLYFLWPWLTTLLVVAIQIHNKFIYLFY